MHYIGYFIRFFFKHMPKSSTPFGVISKKCRYHICKHLFSSCGKDVNIECGADFGSGRMLKIGDRSGIGVDCILSGEITIGHDVMMAPRCALIARNHAYKDSSTTINQQGYEEMKPIIIGNDVWLGYGVIILGGVKISDGAIIGAGSIVTKNVEAYSIVVGNPAKKVSTRIK